MEEIPSSTPPPQTATTASNIQRPTTRTRSSSWFQERRSSPLQFEQPPYSDSSSSLSSLLPAWRRMSIGAIQGTGITFSNQLKPSNSTDHSTSSSHSPAAQNIKSSFEGVGSPSASPSTSTGDESPESSYSCETPIDSRQHSPSSSSTQQSGDESNIILLGKRSIQHLFNQIDPSGKLDPEVEDVLLEIADDFIDSVSKISCSLAKHRKSSSVEAKDILLALEKYWNIRLPEFGGDGYEEETANENDMGGAKDSILATHNSTGTALPEKQGPAATTN